MNFTQDFRGDFNQMLHAPEPFALVRFGDGERMILEKLPGPTADGWTVDCPDEFRMALWDALECDLPEYYLGLCCECCDADAHRFLVGNVRAPRERLTFSNIFVNANYDEAFSNLYALSKESAVVCCHDKAVFRVPANAVNEPWDIDGLVDRLCSVKTPILVAAGPAANIIIHRYWKRMYADPGRQTIVDIGSVLDPVLFNRATRGYHFEDHANRSKVCVWEK